MIIRYKSMSISKKILVMLLIVSIIPIIAIQIILNYVSTTTIVNQTKALIKANLEQSSRNVNNVLTSYDRIIMLIYSDREYAQLMDSLNEWDRRSYYLSKNKLTENLEKIINVNKGILGIAIVGNRGDVVCFDSITLSGNKSYCFDLNKISRMPDYKDSLIQNKTIYSSVTRLFNEEYGSTNSIYVIHRLTDYYNYDKGPLGSIIICVDEKTLTESYSQEEDKDYNLTFIINKSGEVVSSPVESLIGKKILLSGEDEVTNDYILDFLHINGIFTTTNVEINTQKIKDGEFFLINAQNFDYALRNVNLITLVIILIGVLFSIISVFIAFVFSESTDMKVKNIISAMHLAYDQNDNKKINLQGNDEFMLISEQFNEMHVNITKARQQERDALLRQKNAEINFLEAQINPHFLYNTLDAINWVAIDNEQFKISKMLNNLASILRYSIHKSSEIVTVENDLKYIQIYVYLQQQRFNNSFEFILNVHEDVKGLKIHKLLAQPIIENAIVHAFPSKNGRDKIELILRRCQDDFIEIIVKDNGVGIDKETLELYNNWKCKGIPKESIGIRNTISRIGLYYGEEGSLNIESNSEGTKVTIYIPYEKEKEVFHHEDSYSRR